MVTLSLLILLAVIAVDLLSLSSISPRASTRGQTTARVFDGCLSQQFGNALVRACSRQSDFPDTSVPVLCTRDNCLDEGFELAVLQIPLGSLGLLATRISSESHQELLWKSVDF